MHFTGSRRLYHVPVCINLYRPHLSIRVRYITRVPRIRRACLLYIQVVSDFLNIPIRQFFHSNQQNIVNGPINQFITYRVLSIRFSASTFLSSFIFGLSFYISCNSDLIDVTFDLRSRSRSRSRYRSRAKLETRETSIIVCIMIKMEIKVEFKIDKQARDS